MNLRLCIATTLAITLCLAPAALADSGTAIGGEEGWVPSPFGSDAHPAIGGEEGWRPTGPEATDPSGNGSGNLKAAPWPGSDLDLSSTTGTADTTTAQTVIINAAETDALVHIDPCGDIPLGGTCLGGVLTWCDDDGSVTSQDCEGLGHACGWDATNGYFGCLDAASDISSMDLVTPKLNVGSEQLLTAGGEEEVAGCQAGGGAGAGPLWLAFLALMLVTVLRRRVSMG